MHTNILKQICIYTYIYIQCLCASYTNLVRTVYVCVAWLVAWFVCVEYGPSHCAQTRADKPRDKQESLWYFKNGCRDTEFDGEIRCIQKQCPSSTCSSAHLLTCCFMLSSSLSSHAMQSAIMPAGDTGSHPLGDPERALAKKGEERRRQRLDMASVTLCLRTHIHFAFDIYIHIYYIPYHMNACYIHTTSNAYLGELYYTYYEGSPRSMRFPPEMWEFSLTI